MFKVKWDVTKPNSKKRTRKDDIPPSIDENETNTQYKSYKQLEAMTQCESHHRHCFISRLGGFDNHCRLDHSEMTLWAKKIVRQLHLFMMTMYLTYFKVPGPSYYI